jgi:hypothetical protein
MKYIRIDNGFSNGGMHTTAITLTILFWYAALIKKMKHKKVYNLSQLKKNMSHIHLPVHTII